MSIYDEIRAERAAQDTQWGGPSHDDEHEPFDWLRYILTHAAKALSGEVHAERGWSPRPDRPFWATVRIPEEEARNPRAYRKQLVRVAALAIAAIEAFDRRSAS